MNLCYISLMNNISCCVFQQTSNYLDDHFNLTLSGKKICGEVLNATLGSQGTLSHVIDASDLSFDGHCRWHIQASVNHTVELKILKLVIPDIGNNTECKHYLEVSCFLILSWYFFTESYIRGFTIV